ncbi:MAG: helix-turn-helix domain-containing protein [Deltaproteobacteria bacterium]|nr:helix-turn-helix domain-containing protein [Deltaproteobacteria bacterium]
MADLYELLKKPFLNEKEASELTGKALSTLRNDRHLRRGIPYLKVGARDIRYQTQDILSYMTSCRISFDENLNQ